MRTETRDGSNERLILTAMVVDGKVLEAIADRWPTEGLFRTRYGNLVGGWCVRHWRKYGRPPGNAIETIAESWAEKGRDKETVAIVDRFLGSLSADYESNGTPDAEHVIDIATGYFNRVRLSNLAEAIQEDTHAGRDGDAYEALAAYERISLNGDGVVCAADMAMQKVYWLWPGWLATGELAILDGDPGGGKSQLTIDIAARVTRGDAMPLTAAKPRSAKSVLLLTSEDSWSKTMVPRLTAAGADIERVFTMRDAATVTFPADVARLGHAIAAHDARLCVIDPIMAFVSKDIDTHNDAGTRRCLSALRDMAEQTRCAVVMIRHFRKSNAGAIHRGGGSVAWTAACRLQHVVGASPDGTGYVLACGKSNLAERPRSLRYEIVEQRVSVPGKRALKIDTSRV